MTGANSGYMLIVVEWTAWIELYLKKTSILLCNIYRPPTSPLALFDNLSCMLESSLAEGKEVVVIGDLNCNLPNPQHYLTEKLLLCMEDYNLSQIISELSFKRCKHEDLINDLLKAPWQVMDTFDSIDDKRSYWKSLFFSVLDKHDPVVSARKKKQMQAWITPEILQLMSTRNYYKNKHRKSSDAADWKCCKQLLHQVRLKLKLAKEDYFTEVCLQLSRNPREVWSHLNTHLGRKSVSTIVHNGKSLLDTESIASTFNHHFNNLLPDPPTNNSLPSPHVSQSLHPVNSIFKFKNIKEDDVHSKLDTIDINKATGPDGISARFLKTYAMAIYPSITALFNANLTSGVFPDE